MERKFLLAIGLAAFSLTGCLPHPSLTLVEEGCYAEIDPYSSPKSGIIDIAWGEDGVLEVDAYIKTYCAGGEIIGDYGLDDAGGLILKCRIVTKGVVTSCNCTHKVKYRITDIPRTDYSITITETE